ncbi:MAG: hypothetical protein O7C59_10815, partial [Rickettsia endosymbiont of Ixodes persulcatus]|nr:hypothetical protein [Rickettsia endosymbiont of Ixodes persulcatus]
LVVRLEHVQLGPDLVVVFLELLVDLAQHLLEALRERVRLLALFYVLVVSRKEKEGGMRGRTSTAAILCSSISCRNSVRSFMTLDLALRISNACPNSVNCSLVILTSSSSFFSSFSPTSSESGNIE